MERNQQKISVKRPGTGTSIVVGIFSLLMIGLTPVAEAQTGEELFTKTCSICHTVGGGKLIGPDLKDVNSRRKEEWILKFVKGSQALVNSGDADAKAIFDEFKVVMPDQNLTDAEIKSVIGYIATKSGGAPVAAADTSKQAEAPKVASRSAESATPAEILLGKQLFEGSTRFVKGGAACISCHNVNYTGLMAGGVLAKDLTGTYSRIGGDVGLKGLLGAPPFPAMSSAFKDNPLTDDEIFALTAFLYNADKNQLTVAPRTTDSLLIGGGVGFFIIISLIFFLWNIRKKNTVKEAIYNRQLKSH